MSWEGEADLMLGSLHTDPRNEINLARASIFFLGWGPRSLGSKDLRCLGDPSHPEKFISDADNLVQRTKQICYI